MKKALLALIAALALAGMPAIALADVAPGPYYGGGGGWVWPVLAFAVAIIAAVVLFVIFLRRKK